MKETLLLIEDDPDLRRFATQILELANYTVRVAENGRMGLEMARREKPDLILCDIMMTELDGYGVLRARETNPALVRVPFIFITAKSEKSDFRRGMDLGADDYLTKPFSGNDLLKVVSAQIRKRQLLKDALSHTARADKVNSLAEFFRLSGHLSRKKIRKKETLFLEGETPGFLYLVANGKIKTFKTNPWGKEYITEICREGDCFGYKSLLGNCSRSESAVAIENSEVILMPREDFFSLLYSDSEISFFFVRHIIRKLMCNEAKLLHIAYDTARKKVAEALLTIGEKYNPDIKSEVTFPVFRENISAITGLARESISRNISALKKDGLIKTNNNGTSITITDFKKLESLRW